jgi:hypothetical protein
MLDLLLFFWPISALVPPTAEATPSRPPRRRAPSPRAAKKSRRPGEQPKRRRPAPRVLEGGRAGMP